TIGETAFFALRIPRCIRLCCRKITWNEIHFLLCPRPHADSCREAHRFFEPAQLKRGARFAPAAGSSPGKVRPMTAAFRTMCWTVSRARRFTVGVHFRRDITATFFAE